MTVKEMTPREKLAEERGSKDAYYGRSGFPNIWMDMLGGYIIPKDRMTKSEISAYWEGYDNQIDRKEYE